MDTFAAAADGTAADDRSHDRHDELHHGHDQNEGTKRVLATDTILKSIISTVVTITLTHDVLYIIFIAVLNQYNLTCGVVQSDQN